MRNHCPTVTVAGEHGLLIDARLGTASADDPGLWNILHRLLRNHTSFDLGDALHRLVRDGAITDLRLICRLRNLYRLHSRYPHHLIRTSITSHLLHRRHWHLGRELFLSILRYRHISVGHHLLWLKVCLKHRLELSLARLGLNDRLLHRTGTRGSGVGEGTASELRLGTGGDRQHCPTAHPTDY